MPTYAERSIGALDRMFINGGARGFLVAISPADLARVVSPVWVDATTEGA